jgi:hypothetical protein
MKNNSNKLILNKQILIFVNLFIFISTSNGQVINSISFESWPPGCPYNVAPNGWTNFSTNLGPDQAGTCAGVVNSFQGSSHMNLVWSNSGLREGAKQAITGLVTGGVYQVSFYAIHDRGLYADTGSVILDFYHNSTIVFSTPELFKGGSWTLYTATFTALATTDTIGFRVAPGLTGTSGSVGVDGDSTMNITSVNNILEDNEFKIYPNPFIGNISVVINKQNIKQTILTVKNILGQTVFNQQDNNLNSTYTKVINLDFLSEGIYLFDIIVDGKRMVKKIVKE